MNPIQRYFKDGVALFVARLVNLVGNLLMVVWVSRTMGVEAFGSYTAALGLFALFQLGTALGFENLIPREVGRDPTSSDRMFTHSVLVAGIAAVILTGVMDSVALVFNYTPITVLSTWLISLALFPAGMIGVAEAFFIAHRRVEYVSLIYFLEMVGRLVATVAVLTAGGHIPSVLAVHVAFRWLAFIAMFKLHFRFAGQPDWRIQRFYLKLFVRQLFTFSLITLLAALFWNVDLIMLSVFQNEYQLGIYNAAYKLVITWSIVPISYMSVALPILSRLYADGSARFTNVTMNSLRYLAAVALPLALGTTVLGDRIITLLYGDDFSGSITILRLLGWLLVPLFLNNVLYRVLISSDRQSWTLRVTLFGLVSNIILCLVLVPRRGAVGAALASLLAASMSFVINAILVWRLYAQVKIPAAVGRFLVAGALAAGTSWWLKPHVPWLWNAILFAIIYASGAVIVRAVGPDDWALMRRMFRRPVAVTQQE